MEIIQLGQIALIYLQVWADRSHFLLSDKKWGSVKALRWNSHINYECAAHPGADEAALSPTFVKVQVVTTGSLVVVGPIGYRPIPGFFLLLGRKAITIINA